MKSIRTFKALVSGLMKKEKNYAVDICFRPTHCPDMFRWFSVNFTSKRKAGAWMQRVITRFEGHKDFPLDMILLVIGEKGNIPGYVIEGGYYQNDKE